MLLKQTKIVATISDQRCDVCLLYTSVEDLDKELFKAKIQQQSKNMSDEEKQLMIQTLQGLSLIHILLALSVHNIL